MICRVPLVMLVFGTVIFAQLSGRFAVLKSQALDAFERGRYEQVAGKLEEIWEQDHSDAKVAEYLGMGYLYGEHSVAKARPVMKEAVAKGGQATFLIRHSHEKANFLTGDTINNYCSGRMSLSPGKMTFISEMSEHSVTFTAADLKEFRILGGASGRVEMKAGGKTYIFRMKSETRDEADLFEELAAGNLRK